MFTKPDGLPDRVIAAGLSDGWRFDASSLDYRAVGFGSYHWLATDRSASRLFVTVDDLAAKTRTAADTTDLAFGRLHAAFAAAFSLRYDGGLEFVVAPMPAADGHFLRRLTDRYSLVVHPHLDGLPAGEGGEFSRDTDRRAMVGLIARIHQTPASEACSDDFVVPGLDWLTSVLSRAGDGCDWGTGPFGWHARELLRARAGELAGLVGEYHRLAGQVAARPDRMVVTHGEPHAGNVLVTATGPVLVDWESALRSPPERDLWHLAESDESLLDRYASSTGTQVDHDALALYRMWYDLAEIGGYLRLFSAPHGLTADTEESWVNLRQFLRPAERWPSLDLR